MSVSASIVLGPNTAKVGANIAASAEIGNTTVGASASLTYGAGIGIGDGANDLGFEGKLGYGGTYGFESGHRIGLYRTHFDTAVTAQVVGAIEYGYRDFSVRMENDVIYLLGDGRDRWRTAALQLRFRDAVIGFNLWTGDPGMGPVEDRQKELRPGKTDQDIMSNFVYTSESADRYRMGALYVGLRSNGDTRRVGVDAESIRAFIQNGFHSWGVIDSPYFRDLGTGARYYGRLQTTMSGSLY